MIESPALDEDRDNFGWRSQELQHGNTSTPLALVSSETQHEESVSGWGWPRFVNGHHG